MLKLSPTPRVQWLWLFALALTAPLAAPGCSGPCPEACARLTRECQQAPDSYSVAPSPQSAPRACAQVEVDRGFYEALCQEQCQDWKAEAAECLASATCDGDAEARASEVQTCLDGRGRENSERDTTDADVGGCRRDCDKQAQACGDACETAHGDATTCAGCHDNCDRARARCRAWCKLIGQ